MVKITITGDISFSGIEHFSYGKELISLFEQSDLVICNLEAMLTNSNKQRFWKSYYLKAKPEMISLLKPFNAVSMANNHVLDYKYEGLNDTIDLLNKEGINYFGIGLNPIKAMEPFITEKNGIGIAFFGATHYFNCNWINRVGTDDIYSYSLLRRIREQKTHGRFVIVMPHWGYEHVPYPSPRERKLARKLLNAGADVIIGSHPHEMQGREIIEGKAIYYSLGNFIFCSKDFKDKDNQRLYQSYIVELEINDSSSYTHRYLPFVTSDTFVNLAEGNVAVEIDNYAKQISDPLSLVDKQYRHIFYESMYIRYLETRKRASNKGSSHTKLKLISKLKKKILGYTNINIQLIKIVFYIYARKMRLITGKSIQ